MNINRSDLIKAISVLWSGYEAQALRHIEPGLKEISPILSIVHLDSATKLAHFFGQIRQETGARFSVVENLNYTPEKLMSTFLIYRKNPSLAQAHGRTSAHKADQVAIANTAYANRIGNGGVDTNDGWKFRGGGIKQLTGRDNYSGFNIWLKENLPQLFKKYGQKIMTDGADALSTPPLSFLSAIYFWAGNGLYRHANAVTKDASFKVTAIVNRHTDSYDARWSYTKLAHSAILDMYGKGNRLLLAQAPTQMNDAGTQPLFDKLEQIKEELAKTQNQIRESEAHLAPIAEQEKEDVQQQADKSKVTAGVLGGLSYIGTVPFPTDIETYVKFGAGLLIAAIIAWKSPSAYNKYFSRH